MKGFIRTGSLAIILAAVGLATVPAPSLAELPPEAQAAFNKGAVAAQQQDWRLAELSFLEARRSAPDAPELLYNLGLTESKMPGHELRARVWFAAYLTAEPKAANAAAVRQAMVELEVRNQGNIRRLIKLCEGAAAKLPDSPVHQIDTLSGVAMTSADDARNEALAHVAFLWAETGDGEAARQIVHRIGESNEQLARFKLADIAKTLADAGQADDALRTVDAMPEDQLREQALLSIAEADARAGNFQAADEALAQVRQEASAMGDLSVKEGYLVDIATALSRWLVEANDLAMARRTISEAAQMAQEIQTPSRKAGLLTAIGEAQASVGDFVDARLTLAAAIKAAPGRPGDASDVWEDIVRLQANVGDFAGARRRAQSISDQGRKESRLRSLDSALKLISWIQAAAGDLPGAIRTAAGIADPAEAKRARSNLMLLHGVKETELNAARAEPAQEASYPVVVLQVKTVYDLVQTGHLALAQQIAADIAEPQYRLLAQKYVSDATRDRDLATEMTPSDLTYWLDHSLADPVFLDPAEVLETLPAGDPAKMFEAMSTLTNTVVNETSNIDQRIKKLTAP